VVVLVLVVAEDFTVNMGSIDARRSAVMSSPPAIAG
jgi:hypothetical protein